MQNRKTDSLYIKRPNGTQKRYSVHEKKTDGTAKVIKHPIIETLNKAFLAKEISEHSIDAQLRDFIESLRKPKITGYSDENYELLKSFYEKYYAKKRIKDKQSAYNRLRRAVDAVGICSLRSASEQELQDAIDENSTDQRRAVEALNQILKFIGRSDVVLQKDKPKRRVISYLSLSEYLRVRSALEGPIVYLFDTLMATGCRMGEAFTIRLGSNERYVFVEEQLDRKLKKRDTKTSRTRRAPLVSELSDNVKEWIALKDKGIYRNLRHAELLQQAVFNAGLDKKIVAHDLRHSYAIHLLSKGIDLTTVSLALGNTLMVCQEYYTGYELMDEKLSWVMSKI